MKHSEQEQQNRLIKGAVKTMEQASKNTGLTPGQSQALKLVKTCIAGVTAGYVPLSQLQDALKQFNTSLKQD